MTTYLADGWYSPGPQGGLRTEVLDGAMDIAGTLHRAGIAAELISVLALRVRGLVRLGDAGQTPWGEDERAIIAHRLEPLTGDSPELVSFVADCLEHVARAADLTAFYLHLVHIHRMMQLLALAQRGPLEPMSSLSSMPGSSAASGANSGDGANAKPTVDSRTGRARPKAKSSTTGHARKPKRGIATKRQPPKRHAAKAPNTGSKGREKQNRASKRRG